MATERATSGNQTTGNRENYLIKLFLCEADVMLSVDCYDILYFEEINVYMGHSVA
jgi:hypothetical protein